MIRSGIPPTWPPVDFVYTKARERLLNDDVMGRFLEKLMGAPEVKPLLSDEHFSVDGTLLQAWASHVSLERLTERMIHRPRRQGLASVSARPRLERNGPKGISTASSSATRPIAPALIRMRGCAGSPRPIQHCPATGGMCSWTTAMP